MQGGHPARADAEEFGGSLALTLAPPSPRVRGEGIGGLRPPSYTRTPMQSIGYGEGALPLS